MITRTFSRFRLGPKLLFGPIVVLLLLTLLSLAAMLGLGRQTQELKTEVGSRQARMIVTGEILCAMQQAQRNVYQVLAMASASYPEAARAKVSAQALAEMDNSLKRLKSLLTGLNDVNQQQAIEKLLVEVGAYRKKIAEALDMVEDDNTIATTMMLRSYGLWEGIQREMSELNAAQIRQSESALSHAVAFSANMQWWLGVALVVAFVLSAGIALLTSKAIRADIFQIRHAAQCLQDGDLGIHVRLDSQDEIGDTGRAFESLAESLRLALHAVQQDASVLLQHSGDLAQTSSQIESSSAEQVSFAESIATSIEDLSRSIAEVADKAAAVREISRSTEHAMESGLVDLQHMVDRMREVGDKALQTVAVVSQFITDAANISRASSEVKAIAEQTNLLALNAAIEAARAGEQGRGFAVVADEVRKLAERSRLSAEGIEKITGTLSTRADAMRISLEVSAGSTQESHALLTQLSAALQRVHASAAESATEVDHIAAAVREEKTASGDISRRMEQVSRIAHENLNMISEASSAASELTSLAHSLSATTSRFRN